VSKNSHSKPLYVYYSVGERVEKSDEFPTDTYANGITVNQVYMRETFSFFTRSFYGDNRLFSYR